MSLFMTQFSYTTEAWATLVKTPEDRKVPLKAMIEKMGGQLIDLYYCFGEYDGLVSMDAPDENTAAAAVLAATVPGHIKATKTTVLQTVENAMASWAKASAIVYPGPKG